MAAPLIKRVPLIDKIIGYLNPDEGLRRHRARQLLARAYEGASRMDGWRPARAGAGPNTDHMADGAELRNRARALVQNVPYIAHGIEALVANLVGTGIKPRSLSKKRAQTLNELHARWAKECDADGRLDLYGLQKAAVQAMKQDGEVLIRLRPRRVSDGLAVPLQLQLLEIDWLDTSRNGTVNGNLISNGIEYDVLGRVVNYWLFDQHPGEMRFPGRRRATSNPVPANRIIHLFNPERPGQGRGFTCLANVIARVRDLMTYEDAELHRKNLETRLSLVVSGDAADGMPLSESGSAADVKQTGVLGTLESGSITQIPSGMGMEAIEPKPAGGYVEYVKYNLHLIAVGIGITYEMLTGDASEVNYSSARVNQNEFRRLAEQTQWLVLIPKLCEPIWRAFVEAAELMGQADVTQDMAVDWSIPKWSYVNPKEDVAADLNEIFGGLSSFSEKMRVRGYEPDLVFDEMAQDVKKFKDLGLFDFIVMMQTNRTLTEAEAKGKQTSAGGKQ